MQTSFENTFPKTLPGMLYEGGVKESKTRMAEGDDIEYGRGIIAGTNAEDQGKVCDSAAGAFVGISRRYHNVEGVYEDGKSMAVWTKGAITVDVVAADTPSFGDPAYVVVAAGADRGKFTTTSTSNLDTGFKFTKGKVEGNTAVVTIDLAV